MTAPPSVLARPAVLLAGAFQVLIGWALLRVLLAGGQAPPSLPLVAALVSVGALLAVGGHRDVAASGMRCGAHIGVFVFFILYPLADPSSGLGRQGGIAATVGWMIVLTVLGFELGYWALRGRPVRSVPDGNHAFEPSPGVHRALLAVVWAGIVAWTIPLADYMASTGVPLDVALFTMRAPAEGEPLEYRRVLEGELVVLRALFGNGLLLAATAAAAIVAASGRRRPLDALVAWSALWLSAAVGFLSGSRSLFLYAFAPLAVAGWHRMPSRSRLARVVWLATAAVLLVVSWAVMSAVRGGDIRRYAGGFSDIASERHARGALDVYTQLGVVVEGFPARIPFQRGASLAPLMLGWVPRAVWPDKPYPFSLLINVLNGESLERRAASIAVGLPGEGYGNFGLPGVLLWSVLLGLAARRGDDWIGALHPGHVVRAVLAAMGAIWTAMLVRGGVPEMFYQGLAVVLMPFVLAIALERQARRAAATPAGPIPALPVPVGSRL
jgi:hypothetical protein